MAEKVMSWTIVLLSIIIGLGFVLNTRLIPAIPEMLHWIIGAFFILSGGSLAYNAVK